MGVKESQCKRIAGRSLCDELKAYIAPTPDGTGLAEYYLKSEADKVIAELKEERRWRKCSEELPNDGEPGYVDTVLVAVEIRMVDSVQYRVETAFYMDGKFWMTQKKRSTFDKEDFGDFGFLIQKVTHWMPLPSAPKEEK